MADAHLLKLLTWLSPSFPVGAYAYSHGLETAIEDGLVTDAADLERWLHDLLRHGAPRNDAIFMTAVYAEEPLTEVIELALAFQPAMELRLESVQQGRAFITAVAASWPHPSLDGIEGDIPYAVAVALAARAHGIPLASALTAYLHAFLANLVSAAVRAVPLGQKAGLAVIAALEPEIAPAVQAATSSTLDDLGSCTFLNDISAMRHETQHTRLFRS